MASASEVRGFAEVQARLNVEIRAIEGATTRGLILASALIHRDTEATAPLTPVDLGNLRASWFTVTANSVPSGKGTGQFKGTKAGQMLGEHGAVIAEAQSIIAGLDKSSKVKSLMMGYTANYALWVHENIGANFQREGAGPKWFEASVQRNSGKVVQIIRDNIKIP